MTLLFNCSSFKITIKICVHDHDIGFQHFFTAVLTVLTVFSNKLLKYQWCHFKYQLNVLFNELCLNVWNREF